MKNFIYYVPTKIYFGKDEEKRIGELIKDYHPNKVLIHYGKGSVIKSGLLDLVKNKLEENNINYVELGGVEPNPSLSLVKVGISLCQKEGVDFVLALGGGSVMDSAKAIALGVANPEDDVWDYYLGKKKPAKTLHKAAILTIAASGSEMSNSSVISNNETQRKTGISTDLNRFDFSIENPELTYSVSKYQTACGVVDIAMHSIERYFCKGESEITDDIALAVIKNDFKFGKLAYDEPTNYEARANMMWASSLAHNTLTNMGKDFLLSVHQLEHELSGMYSSIAHGAGLAALWCSWARYAYKSNIPRWKKYVSYIWGINTGNDEIDILEGIRKQEEFYHSIGMPISLEELGVKETDLPTLALRCSREHTRILDGYKPLAYLDMLKIYEMAYPKR